jgi:hypothetical protein
MSNQPSSFQETILKKILSQKKYKKRLAKNKFADQRKEFESRGGEVTHEYKILSDWEDQAGTAKGHYFHQDLLVAQFIYQNKPNRHIDIGSRIDGFVAHVAAFRAIEVMDVRALEPVGHPNITFLQADLMQEMSEHQSITDSISCLHALEHFGLGRYGDPLDPEGHHKGFVNLIKMLQSGGSLYVSFPIGRQNEVHFNAHRVFHPRDILNWPTGEYTLELKRFDLVDDEGKLHTEVDLNSYQPNLNYGCGIYTFKKA